MSSDSQKTESRYKFLVVPDFKSTIPPHVLSKLPESERYLVEMVSKMEQRDTWLTDAAKNSNEAEIALDIRVATIEKLIERLTNRWSVIMYLIVVSLPVVLKVLISHWLGTLKP
jgi:hypothetical protein